MKIEDLVNSLRLGWVRISDHAEEEAAADGILWQDVRMSVENGEIIEAYPRDRPYPSCLVFGLNRAQEPVHSVWAYNAKTRWAVCVTVYRPDPERWIDWRVRKEKK